MNRRRLPVLPPGLQRTLVVVFFKEGILFLQPVPYGDTPLLR